MAAHHCVANQQAENTADDGRRADDQQRIPYRLPELGREQNAVTQGHGIEVMTNPVGEGEVIGGKAAGQRHYR